MSETPNEALPGAEPGPISRVVRTSARKGLVDSVLGTRNLMTIAALVVCNCIIFIPINYVSVMTAGTQRGVYLGVGLIGLWAVDFLLPVTIVRRPGAAIVAGLLYGLIGMVATPVGPAAIVGGFLGGAFVELPLLLTFYRFWDWRMFMACATCFGLLNSLLYVASMGALIGSDMNALLVAIGVASGVVGGLLVLGATRLLNMAGVGIDRDAR